MRSGQQAARGCDIVQLADALGLERPIIGGFDWGGNASCVAAVLWPERIGGLVSYAGYDVIDVSRQRYPVAPSLERVFWYQHLFQTERGRECLMEHRRELCRILWSEWSPGWQFDDATSFGSGEFRLLGFSPDTVASSHPQRATPCPSRSADPPGWRTRV
jgi:pimeloyl-ACP methyl ester carboxylesterase